MRVKAGSAISGPKSVQGGVPQGSLLGVLLFNATIDFFETRSNDVKKYGGFLPQLPPIPPGPVPVEVEEEPTDRDYLHLPPFKRTPITVSKYVDDNVMMEKLNFDRVPTDGHSFRTKHAKRTQNLFQMISHESEYQKMRVNAAKTQSLCISDLKSYVPRAFFFAQDGTQISSGDNMKILGVEFSSLPDMSAQVKAIKRSFVARVWFLRHLGHLGMNQEDLLAVYKSMILPMHDYCSCVYNSSLTITQSGQLERLQALALKAIYGMEHSYRSLLALSGLPPLKIRRDRRCDKFATKCANSERFGDWFPRNDPLRVTRNPLEFKEERARTKRLYNSPLYHMRRRLNGREE